MAAEKKIPQLEFKSGDDAWYDVAIELDGLYLKVHYEEFTEEDDEMLPLKEHFKTVEDIRSRFRFSSRQLQDQHCDRLKEGMDICVSFSSDGDDNRFFDAVVKQVHRSKHHVVDGEEQCACTFKVLWQAGPVANRRTTVSCGNICLLSAGSIEIHPVINDLLSLVEDKLDSRRRSVGRNPLRSKNTDTKGRDTTNFKARQAQPRELADDRHMACETPNRRDEVSSSNAREVSDDPGSISLQPKENEKKCEEEICATENVLTSYEVLLQERVTSDNELKSSVESECDVGSETNTFRYSYRDTTLKEDGIFSKITSLQGEIDICKDDSLPPEAASLTLQNKNIQHEVVPKNSKEATIDAEILSESHETNLIVGRKEQKPNLPDLNSLPVELETMHPCSGPVSSAMGYTDTVGNNLNTTDQTFWQLDDSVVIIRNVWPCNSGWLEAEDSDDLLEECTDHNVVCNATDNSGRISKQLTISENQKGQEITEDRSENIHFLSSWGKGKRHMHSNEMLASERLVQGHRQKGEGTKTSKNFLQFSKDSGGVDTLRSSLTTLPLKPLNPKEPLDCYRGKCGIQGQTLQNVEEIENDLYEDKLPIKYLRSNKVQAHIVSLGAMDNNTGEFINDAIDTLNSSCLTTSSTKPIKKKDLFDRIKDSSGPPKQTTREYLDCFRDECGIQDQTLQNVEEVGKDVYGDKLPVKSLRSNEVQTPKVSLGAVNNINGEFINVDIDGLKSNCLKTSSMTAIKRKGPTDSYKDSSGSLEKPMKKVHIDVCAPRQKELDYEVCPLEVLPETVAISSDDESDHAFPRKERDNGSKDFIRQHSDHVHLQEVVHTTIDPPRDGHMNEPGLMEDNSFCKSSFKGQKNVPVTQRQCSGHSLSEKWNYCSSGGPSHCKGLGL